MEFGGGGEGEYFVVVVGDGGDCCCGFFEEKDVSKSILLGFRLIYVFGLRRWILVRDLVLWFKGLFKLVVLFMRRKWLMLWFMRRKRRLLLLFRRRWLMLLFKSWWFEFLVFLDRVGRLLGFLFKKRRMWKFLSWRRYWYLF